MLLISFGPFNKFLQASPRPTEITWDLIKYETNQYFKMQ